MNQTHSRTPCQQVQWVSTLLAQRGSYGVVTMVSQELGVARQTLYRWKAKGQAALEATFTPFLHTADRSCPLERGGVVLTQKNGEVKQDCPAPCSTERKIPDDNKRQQGSCSAVL